MILWVNANRTHIIIAKTLNEVQKVCQENGLSFYAFNIIEEIYKTFLLLAKDKPEINQQLEIIKSYLDLTNKSVWDELEPSSVLFVFNGKGNKKALEVQSLLNKKDKPGIIFINNSVGEQNWKEV